MRDELDTEPVDLRIARRAERQGGVISTEQLVGLGLTPSSISRRVRRGTLHPLHRGVYAVGHRRVDALGRWHAAVLACGAGAVLSHRSAAAAWELQPMPSGPVDVTVPSSSGRARRMGIRLHRVATLTEQDVTTRGDLRITTAERTLLDLAGVARPIALEQAVEQAGHRRIVDHDELARLAATRRSGARALRGLLDEPLTLTRSALERRFLALCRRYGIPRPLVNTQVGSYEVDFLWLGARLIVETDGREHHGTRRAFEDDRRRDADLTAAGYRVVRFTHRQIAKEPGWVAERLALLLAGVEAQVA
jgi:very-short-patch-repair endonuclease